MRACVRGAETGRGYAAGRCYTRALLLAGSVHGTDRLGQGGIIVQAVKRMLERWRTLTEDRQEASGNVVQVAEPRRAERQEGS